MRDRDPEVKIKFPRKNTNNVPLFGGKFVAVVDAPDPVDGNLKNLVGLLTQKGRVVANAHVVNPPRRVEGMPHLTQKYWVMVFDVRHVADRTTAKDFSVVIAHADELDDDTNRHHAKCGVKCSVDGLGFRDYGLFGPERGAQVTVSYPLPNDVSCCSTGFTTYGSLGIPDTAVTSAVLTPGNGDLVISTATYTDPEGFWYILFNESLGTNPTYSLTVIGNATNSTAVPGLRFTSACNEIE
jgi:hypothetical protein